MHAPSSHTRSVALGTSVLVQLLFAWALLGAHAQDPPAQQAGDPAGVLQLRLISAAPRAPPAPLQAPHTRLLPAPDWSAFAPQLPAETLPTFDLAQAHAESTQGAATSNAPNAPASARAAPRPASAIDCLPLHWLRGVSQRIGHALHYPPSARQLRQRGTAYVRVSVARSGAVIESPLLRGTGHRALDLEAQAVIQRIGRFAPVPADACVGADILVIDQPIQFGLRRL